MNRRDFLTRTAALSAASVLPRPLFAASGINVQPAPLPRGKADHCIFMWLGGGMSQVDTFDPKKRGNSKGTPRQPGTDYNVIDTIVPGVQFTEHLSRSARLADRLTAIRTVNHHVIDEHAFATNLVHTGRLTSGSTVYPSIGSVVAHERGAASDAVPAYMLIGTPNISRGPGFLGSRHGYVYTLDTESGPAGFSRPQGIDADRAARRQQLLVPLQEGVRNRPALADQEQAQREALRLTGTDFMRHFKLAEESSALRERYGSEFGQRCLLARRLIEGGVRFIEVSHNLNFINGTGWDTHKEGQLKQHVLIQELDSALSTLIEDLESKRLLDRTLIVVATEFGRPWDFDGGGGRGHQGSVFTMVLAGGGLRHRGAYGNSDDASAKVVEHAVSIPDFHATIHAALSINPSKELLNAARPVPITDGGKPIAALFG
jgi:hypothetical protein